jgi:hypothetical protein
LAQSEGRVITLEEGVTDAEVMSQSPADIATRRSTFLWAIFILLIRRSSVQKEAVPSLT